MMLKEHITVAPDLILGIRKGLGKEVIFKLKLEEGKNEKEGRLIWLEKTSCVKARENNERFLDDSVCLRYCKIRNGAG